VTKLNCLLRKMNNYSTADRRRRRTLRSVGDDVGDRATSEACCSRGVSASLRWARLDDQRPTCWHAAGWPALDATDSFNGCTPSRRTERNELLNWYKTITQPN